MKKQLLTLAIAAGSLFAVAGTSMAQPYYDGNWCYHHPKQYECWHHDHPNWDRWYLNDRDYETNHAFHDNHWDHERTEHRDAEHREHDHWYK